MSGHTRGPWTYLDIGEVVPEDDIEVTVATLDYGRERAEADGNLIAAAPDLLELLREGAQDMSNGARLDWKARAEVAIARAEGQP